MEAATRSIPLYSETPCAPDHFHTVNLLLSQQHVKNIYLFPTVWRQRFIALATAKVVWLGWSLEKTLINIRKKLFSCAESLRIIHFPYPNELIPSFLKNKQVPCVLTKHTLTFLVCVHEHKYKHRHKFCVHISNMYAYVYVYVCVHVRHLLTSVKLHATKDSWSFEKWYLFYLQYKLWWYPEPEAEGGASGAEVHNVLCRFTPHESLSSIQTSCLLQGGDQETGQSLSLCDKGTQTRAWVQLLEESLRESPQEECDDKPAIAARAAFPASVSTKTLRNGFVSAFHIVVSGQAGHRILTSTDKRGKLNPHHANHPCCSLSAGEV